MTGFATQGQNHTCGFDDFLHKNMAENPELYFEMDTFRSIINNRLNDVQERSEIIIPVVVHVVWKEEEENISDEQICSQIEVLNRLFDPLIPNNSDIPEEFRDLAADVGIRFCIAEQEINGETQKGIIRQNTTINNIGLRDELFATELGGSTAWDTRQYLNIWVTSLGTALTGYASFPMATTEDRDGVVIHHAFFGKNDSRSYGLGKVTVHEIGHYLGLFHTWGNCEDDDGIDDTPLQKDFYFGCPSFPQSSCGSLDMFMNYMDYIDDPCALMFTLDQKATMLATLNAFRPQLTNHHIACAECSVQMADDELMTLYPNPVSHKLVLNTSSQVEPGTIISIFNTTGQLVQLSEHLGGKEMVIEVSSLSSGMYLLKLKSKVEKFSVFR